MGAARLLGPGRSGVSALSIPRVVLRALLGPELTLVLALSSEQRRGTFRVCAHVCVGEPVTSEHSRGCWPLAPCGFCRMEERKEEGKEKKGGYQSSRLLL